MKTVKVMSSMGNKKIQKAGGFFLMVVSILGKKQSKHMKFRSFSARLFLNVLFWLQWSYGLWKTVQRGKNPTASRKDEDWNIILPCLWRLQYKVWMRWIIQIQQRSLLRLLRMQCWLGLYCLNQGIISIRLAFYRNYPLNPGQGHSRLCFLSAAQTQPQHGTCNIIAQKLLLF